YAGYMDRTEWLAERRGVVERSYDTLAPTYDQYDPATPMPLPSVARFIGQVPQGGTVLDAGCGTPPYAGPVPGPRPALIRVATPVSPKSGSISRQACCRSPGRNGPQPASSTSACRNSPSGRSSRA